MKEQLYMLIKTDSRCVGDFDGQLVAYTFGGDNYSFRIKKELDLFDKEMDGEVAEEIYEYLDSTSIGGHDFVGIGSHPTNKDYIYDTIYIGLKKEFPEDLLNVVVNRLKSFCDYYEKEHNQKIQILNIDYYREKLVKEEEIPIEMWT